MVERKTERKFSRYVHFKACEIVDSPTHRYNLKIRKKFVGFEGKFVYLIVVDPKYAIPRLCIESFTIVVSTIRTTLAVIELY